LPRTLHGRSKYSIALAVVCGALLAPAVASADYDLTLRFNVTTTGVSETTAGGVTTFRATAPGALLSPDDVGNAALAGNDIAIESGEARAPAARSPSSRSARASAAPSSRSR
jgi:hypothetical protein